MSSGTQSQPTVTPSLRPWQSIRGRLALFTTVLMGVIATFILLFFPAQQRSQAEEAAALTTGAVAEMAANALASAVARSDSSDVSDVLAAVVAIPGVDFVQVDGIDGQRIAGIARAALAYDPIDQAQSPSGFATGAELYTARRDIGPRDNSAGSVVIGYSLEGLNAVVRSSQSLIMYASLLVFLFGLAGVYAISYVITEPLRQMVGAANKVSDGDFAVRVKSNARTEVGELAKTFNIMVGSLQTAYASLESANATLAHHSEELQIEVAERGRAEKALRLSESRFRAVVEQATDVVLVIDSSGELQYVSPPLRNMLGLDPQRLIGTDFSALVHPEDRPIFACAVGARDADCSGERDHVISIELRCRHSGGDWRYLALRGRVLNDLPGIEGTLFNVSDVTDVKQYQQQLVDARDTAEKMARLKDSFLANMSHEIRTPLTGILGFAQVLRHEVGEEHHEMITFIQEAGTRLLNTLNSVLDLAQLEANALDMQLEVVNLSQEVWDSVKLIEPLAQVKQLKLTCSLPDEPVFAEVDKRCLYRILNNLVTNALKFTDEGGVYVTVGMSDLDVFVEVRDTGVGVSAEFLPHIFDEFKQESTGLSRTHEGSGLGLAITRRLVELHGGAVTASSEKGVGTTFTVRLPKSEPSGKIREALAPRQPDRRPSVASGRRRILLVEDNADTRLLLKRILSDQYDLVDAATPSAALRIGRSDKFDLVLMDISLGDERDGVQVMRELRATGNFEKVPFLAVTAYALPGDRSQFLTHGFDDYLSKPFRKEDLLEMVQRHMMHGAPRVAN